MSDNQTRAAIYLRISKDTEGRGVGVDRQRDECLALAERLGYAVEERFYSDNDISAYSGKRRPEFERLIFDAQAGKFDVVICWATDRLYRLMSDLTRITKELAPHVKILSVMGGDVDLSTAEGVLRAQVMGSVAEFESSRKSERLKAMWKQRTTQGRVATGRRPFGWAWIDPCPGGDECQHTPSCEVGSGRRARVGGRPGVVPHEIEGPYLAKLLHRVANGELVVAQVVRILHADGFSESAGMKFQQPTVKEILISPRHAGLTHYKGEIIGKESSGLRLIEPEVHERIVFRLVECARRLGPKKGGRPAKSLLTGIGLCGVCGRTIVFGKKVQDPEGIYRCVHSNHFSRAAHYVEEPVLDLVGDWIERNADGILALSRPLGEDTEAVAAHRLVETLEQRRDDVAAAYAEGLLTIKDFTSAVTRVVKDLEIARERNAVLNHRNALAALGIDGDPLGRWKSLCDEDDTEAIRNVLMEIVDRVVVNKPATHYHPAYTDTEVTLRNLS